MVLANLSILEWIIIGLGLLAIAIYIAYSIYRKKHPKKKEDDEE